MKIDKILNDKSLTII